MQNTSNTSEIKNNGQAPLGSRLLDPAGLTLLLFVLTAPHAFAYVDATTGSYVFELFIGLILTLTYSVKLLWRKWIMAIGRPPLMPGKAATPTNCR